jgi:cytidylate kinase
MIIANNILRHHLKSVYWVGGTACGGKTTMAKELSQKYNMYHYNADEMFDQYRELCNKEDQPALNLKFDSADKYFNRPIDEYLQYLNKLNNEMFGMMVVDLLKLSVDKQIIVEGHYPPDLMNSITTYNKVAFLYAEEDIIRKDYLNRDDKKDMLKYIKTTSNSDNIINHVLDVVIEGSKEQIEVGKRCELKFFKRDSNSTVAGTISALESHFGLHL